MPWVRAMLRGQTVFARATPSGELSADAGRVEIRYKANDGRAYRALARNLDVVPGAVLPDDACGPAEAAPERGAAEGAKGGKAGAAKRPGAAKAAEPAHHAPPGADELVFYTDGACTGNPGPAGLGVYVVEPKRAGDGAEPTRPREISEYLGHATNNVAELTAILRALELLDATSHEGRARVFTDSQYAIGVLQKGWRAKANQELVAEIRDRLRARRGVVLTYVPGHAGVSGNERADQLAREAVRSRRSRRTGC